MNESVVKSMNDNELKFFDTIIERETIFIRKELLGSSYPFTADPIFANYKFCNVHRCLDKVYRLIENLNIKDVAIKGLLRWSSSRSLLEYLTYSEEANSILKEADISGNPKSFIDFIFRNSRKDKHLFNIVTGSFIVCCRNSNGLVHQMTSIYNRIKDVWLKVEKGDISTTQDAVSAIKFKEAKISDFTAYCIVSDWIYSNPEKFTDLKTWTSYGRGAFNGLKDIYDEDSFKINLKNYLSMVQNLLNLWEDNSSYLVSSIEEIVEISKDEISRLCLDKGFKDVIYLVTHPIMLDVEHWLCEFHKYNRGYCRGRFKPNYGLF